MTKDQEDNLNMYQATDDVLQKPEHNLIWAANVPFSDAVDRLEANIDSIQNLRDQQDEDTTGVTQDKKNRRDVLEQRTISVGSIVVFYASVTNNRNLLEKVNFTQSALRNARDNELPGMSIQVHEEAAANSAALLPYGLTPGMITALQNAITEFGTQISKPRSAKSETSAATDQMPKVFADTIKVLEEQLDMGMELYRVSNADFYAQYHNARIVVNSPTLKRALELKFVDNATGNPIEHVIVLIDGNLKRRSTALGNIHVQNLSEGAHFFTASLPGYNPVSQNFNVITGETTKIVVGMVKV